MIQLEGRFDRSERLFGKEGQSKLRETSVLVVGVGGLGTHVVPQIALLGVGAVTLVDDEELSRSNRNRYIGARHDDPIPGFAKVNLGARAIGLTDPSVKVTAVRERFPSRASLNALRAADCVFGCVDNDGARFVLNEACLAYGKPLFDLATDVPEPGKFGGRVDVVTSGTGCLYCRGLLDANDVRRSLSPTEVLENEAAIYGVDPVFLGQIGPSVVSLNGVVASLAVTEFMVAATGMRAPIPHLEYRGDMGIVRKRPDSSTECYYCEVIRGQGDAAMIERYLGDALGPLVGPVSVHAAEEHKADPHQAPV